MFPSSAGVLTFSYLLEGTKADLILDYQQAHATLRPNEWFWTPAGPVSQPILRDSLGRPAERPQA